MSRTQGHAFARGAFVKLQRAYAEHDIATYPLTEDKTPAVRGYDRVGAKGSEQLAMKFPAALAAGFVAGRRNRLTIIDIDSADDRLLDEIQGRFGTTPLQVRTPSGGRHLYCRYGGEGRRIRPFPDVDVLGAGNVVAALSAVPNGRYQIERGSLDDLAALPPMRQQQQQRPAGRIPKGQRNLSLFEFCRRTVAYCDDFDQLLDAARTWADRQLEEGLPAAEIAKTCISVWQYRGGRKRIMNRIVESQAYATLKMRPYAMALFSILAAENGPDSKFWIANGLADALGWPRRSIQEGRRTLLQLGIVECVRRECQGHPAVYRWAAQDPADVDPGLPYLVSYPSSPSPCYPALGSAAERPPEAVVPRPQIATDDSATAGGRDHVPASLCIPGDTAMTDSAMQLLQVRPATDVSVAVAAAGMMPMGTEL